MRIVVALSLLAVLFCSCGTIPSSTIAELEDKTFFLDEFRTDTLGTLSHLLYSEDDTKGLQDHYARTTDIASIKKTLENKFGIIVDTSEFEAARKDGAISADPRSTYKKAYGQKISSWESRDGEKHRNKILICYSILQNQYIGGGLLPVTWVYILLQIDGKFVMITEESGLSNNRISAREICQDSDPKKWLDFHHACIDDLTVTLLYQIRNVKL